MAVWAVADGWQGDRQEPNGGYGGISACEQLQFAEGGTETGPGLIVNLD